MQNYIDPNSQCSPADKPQEEMTHQPPQGNVMPTQITREENICDLHSGAVLGQLISREPLPSSYDVCWYCTNQGDITQLYKPCNCLSWIHRSCLREWRVGWINPRNYFCCPNCMYNYDLKRVRPESDLTRGKILLRYRIGVLKIWLCTVIIFGSLISAIAFIGYFADRDDKNIPIGVRYMLTSIAYGLPGVNGTLGWREEFKEENTMVWPYYGVLGLLCASIAVLIIAAIVGSTQSEERRTGNCYDCCCGGGCCTGWTGNSSYTSSTHVDATCLCLCSSGGGGDGSMDCISCDNISSCGGGSGDGEGMVIIFVVIIIVAVVIVASAIAVIVIYACQKWSLFYTEMCRMLDSQQRELEGETVVLGKNERFLPYNAV